MYIAIPVKILFFFLFLISTTHKLPELLFKKCADFHNNDVAVFILISHTCIILQWQVTHREWQITGWWLWSFTCLINFSPARSTCLIFSRKWWIQNSCYIVPKFSYVILRKSTIHWFKLLITNSVQNSPMIFPSQWHGVVCMLMFRLSKNKQNILTFKHNSLRDALKMNKVWDNFFSELEKPTQTK